jgi:signal transduction histidine kinase
MEVNIKKIEMKAKKDFDNTICIMSIIPLLTFFYVLVGKLASFAVLAGEIGYIMLVIIMLILFGILAGKRILWNLITKLIEFSQQILKMEKELIEKNRLSAITETVLSLGHEINNPLLVMQGNLEVLEGDLGSGAPENLRNRLTQIKHSCERIMEVTLKLSQLSKPVSTSIHGDVKMVDLSKSE